MGRFTNHRNIKVSNQRQECENGDDNSTLPWHRHLPCGRTGEGWHFRGLWVLSLARNGLLSLGYQPSPVTPRWSSRAVLLFHYHRGSRSMERRHHYPSGLMRLSHCRKGQAITAGAVFSLEIRSGWLRDGGEIDSTHRHRNKQTNPHKGCLQVRY